LNFKATDGTFFELKVKKKLLTV